MKHHVHCSDAKHRLVGVKTGEHLGFELIRILSPHQLFAVMLGNIVGGFQQEARRSHGRIENMVFQCGLHQFYHHPDDVTRGTKLTIFTRCRNLAEKILVNIAHNVFIVHIHGVDTINNLGKHLRRGDQKNRVLHIAAERRIFAVPDLFYKREHIVLHIREHCSRLKIVKDIPTKISVFSFHMGILTDDTDTISEHLLFQLNTERICTCLCFQLIVIQ